MVSSNYAAWEHICPFAVHVLDCVSTYMCGSTAVLVLGTGVSHLREKTGNISNLLTPFQPLPSPGRSVGVALVPEAFKAPCGVR